MLMYHGTADVLLPSIQSKGLIPGFTQGADAWAKEHGRAFDTYRQEEQRKGIYLVPDVDDAAQFAQFAREMHPGSKPIVLAVDVPEPSKLVPDTAADYYKAQIYPAIIPPSAIKSIKPVSVHSSRITIRNEMEYLFGISGAEQA